MTPTFSSMRRWVPYPTSNPPPGGSGIGAMARFLVDTDVFIDHLRAGRRVPVPPEEAAYSSITRAELYAGRGTDEAVVDRLLDAFEEIPVDRPVAEEAGRIRRATALTLPDAIIAATSLATARELLSRNVRHFGAVPGLRLARSPG